MEKSLLKSIRVIAYTIFLISTFYSSTTFAQGIRGKVIDAVTKEPVGFANIITPKTADRRANGVSANENGEFFISLAGRAPYVLEVSRIGYVTKTVKFDSLTSKAIIELVEDATMLDGFVISSEKMTQEELKLPIDMVKITQRDIQLSPSFNYFDVLGNMKGVDLTTQSTVINSVNARGFSSSMNPRFRQFVDGMDSQTPGFGFSLGNLVGPSILDIEGVELIPGPTTAQYGPSAMNGVLMVKSKSPLDYTGFSMTAKGASIALDQNNKEFFKLGNFISEVSARYAVAWKEKVGFKISGTYLNGEDFRARNYFNKGPGERFDREYSKDNQSIDAVNKYGDDRASLMVGNRFGGQDTVFYLTRDGYREEDLTNYKVKNYKYNAQLDVQMTKRMRLSLISQYAIADAMITHVDRFALRDFELSQYKVELQSDEFLFRAYTTSQNAGNSYNVGGLADLINQTAKPEEAFVNDFRDYYNNRTTPNLFIAAREYANTTTNSGYLPRFNPGTERYDSLRTLLISSLLPGQGVGLFDQSKLYHGDLQYNFKNRQEIFSDLLFGASYRFNDPNTNGVAYPDSEINDITNYEYGIYGQATKSIGDKTELTASVRFDKNENFDPKVSQRLSAIYQLNEKSVLRGSVLRGYRFPTIVEQFQDFYLGDKRLTGGLQQITDAYDLEGNSFYLNGLAEYNERIFEDVNLNGDRYQTARINHQNIMADNIVKPGTFSGIEPEQITTVELGFRSLIQDRRIIEVSVFRNYYENFIGNLRVVKPRTSPSTDLLKAIDQANQNGASDIIFVTANSDKQIITQGVEFLYDITGQSGVNFSVNAAFASIIQDADDPLIPGFNTAPFKWNVTLGHRRISRTFGASLTWRSRTTFDWQSPFADGPVDDFSTFDIQLSYSLPDIHSMIRLGANNVHNIDQFNTFGGPEINAFYYLSLTYDPFQAR